MKETTKEAVGRAVAAGLAAKTVAAAAADAGVVVARAAVLDAGRRFAVACADAAEAAAAGGDATMAAAYAAAAAAGGTYTTGHMYAPGTEAIRNSAGADPEVMEAAGTYARAVTVRLTADSAAARAGEDVKAMRRLWTE